MEIKYWVYLIICILISILLGYLIGKNSLKPKGAIVYETYYDEESKDERVRCTFKLDMDVDEIVMENYILFQVQKDQKVLQFYENEKNSLNQSK